MRKILNLVCGTIVAGCLTACGSSTSGEVLTAREFQSKMEDAGFTVVDQTDSAADDSYQEIYVATEEEKYSFEYYFMKNDESADTVYQYAVTNLKNTYDSDSSAEINEKDKGTNAKYEVSASDYYCNVLKKDNTVLYITSYVDYEKEAKEIIKNLGY